MSLTTAQMADARRFMGYQAVGTTMTINGNTDLVYARFGMITMSLYTRLTTLTADEEAILTGVYLTNLTAFEQAIVGVSANLDTDQAAVWTHNKNEQRDRERLFDGWRVRLCAFLGFPPGPALGSSSSVKLSRA